MNLAQSIASRTGDPEGKAKSGKEPLQDWNEVKEDRKLYQDWRDWQRNLREWAREY